MVSLHILSPSVNLLVVRRSSGLSGWTKHTEAIPEPRDAHLDYSGQGNGDRKEQGKEMSRLKTVSAFRRQEGPVLGIDAPSTPWKQIRMLWKNETLQWRDRGSTWLLLSIQHLVLRALPVLTKILGCDQTFKTVYSSVLYKLVFDTRLIAAAKRPTQTAYGRELLILLHSQREPSFVAQKAWRC